MDEQSLARPPLKCEPKGEFTMTIQKHQRVHKEKALLHFNLELSQKSYNLGGVQVYCWRCRGGTPFIAEGLPSTNDSHTVCLYSAPCGLVCIDLPDEAVALEVFELMTRYEVSPYHAEDILEDREIPAVFHFL